MLGLTALEHKVMPESTLEKIFFLVDYGFTKSHRPTAIVSACALAGLVTLRLLKASLHRFKWIARIPEVLIVVIVSTSTFLWPSIAASRAYYLQFYRMSYAGTMTALPSLAMCLSTQVATSSSFPSTINTFHT